MSKDKKKPSYKKEAAVFFGAVGANHGFSKATHYITENNRADDITATDFMKKYKSEVPDNVALLELNASQTNFYETEQTVTKTKFNWKKPFKKDVLGQDILKTRGAYISSKIKHNGKLSESVLLHELGHAKNTFKKNTFNSLNFNTKLGKLNKVFSGNPIQVANELEASLTAVKLAKKFNPKQVPFVKKNLKLALGTYVAAGFANAAILAAGAKAVKNQIKTAEAKPQKNYKVSFIRKNGRVIPVKQKV